ncbi:MAG TPA: family 20 glycosylhydrolase, partial [Pyrinomonadaceae bacterium]|nr:family 20 glycosylhydrolase [Pyrinomonadaceae bacterium]
MKGLFAAIAVALSLASVCLAQSDKVNIIPKPRSVSFEIGNFSLRKDTWIVVMDEGSTVSAGILNEYLLKKYGFKLRIVNKLEKRNAIVFYPVAVDHSGGEINEIKREKYSLHIAPDRVSIGGTWRGQYYALQSLLQILPVEFDKEATLPALTIVDAPRFPYRGMHLDVVRHFQPVEFVKKFIDQMSQYKFNTFHWHLTDDQGWRIEIKKYPKLTVIGSKRPETVKERNLTPYIGDGIPHGGFYTQEQIKEVVAYAKTRHITVVPEIELPGHASAALAAYPQFGCKADYQYKVQTTWGIFKEVYCPTDATFKFLEDVLDETIALFPDSPYIHIGGDEVLKDHWKESPFVQDLMRRENLKDEHEVQSYFVRRIEKYINAKGKKIIGWDEILEGGLAPNATVMSWRGMKGGIEAARSKHDVIMTPTDYVYLDYGQGDPAYEPLNIGSYVPLEKVYSFEPIPPELTADEAKYIIGGQANIWTEYIKTPSHVEYMAFPRMLALSEVLWSKKEDRNLEDFNRRLSAILPRLDKQNVNYRIPEPRGLANNVIAKNSAISMEIRSEIPGAKVLYTIDGSDPNEKSPVIPTRLVINPRDEKIVTLKTIVVLPSSRKSSVYAATFVTGSYLPSVEPTGKTQGVTYSLYVPSNAYAQDTMPQKGESKSIGLQQFAQRIDPKQTFGVTFDGYINAPLDGIYEFQADSTWDRTITVGDQILIDEAGTK